MARFVLSLHRSQISVSEGIQPLPAWRARRQRLEPSLTSCILEFLSSRVLEFYCPTHDLAPHFRSELSYRLDPEWISRGTIKRNRYPPAWQQQHRGCERSPCHGQEVGLPSRLLRFFEGFSRRETRVDRRAFSFKSRSGWRHRCDRVHPGS